MNMQKKIDKLMLDLGFNTEVVNKNMLYRYGDKYYRISYIHGFNAYVIEYANNIDEAQKDLLEDGDLYLLSLGEDQLLKKLRADLLRYYIR